MHVIIYIYIYIYIIFYYDSVISVLQATTVVFDQHGVSVFKIQLHICKARAILRVLYFYHDLSTKFFLTVCLS